MRELYRFAWLTTAETQPPLNQIVTMHPVNYTQTSYIRSPPTLKPEYSLSVLKGDHIFLKHMWVHRGATVGSQV